MNAQAYGIGEALKQLAIEQYTANEIVRVVESHGVEDAVDLVAGGHIDLLFSEEDAEYFNADYEAAKQAGVDVSAVEWYTKEDMIRVRDTSSVSAIT